MSARHYRVIGQVQGVWFRAACQAHATALGLTGWVANQPDGSVEVVAEGPVESLDRFTTFLQAGPGQSSVRQLLIDERAPDGSFPDFTVR